MFPPILEKLSALVGRRSRAERRVTKRLFPGAMTPCEVQKVGESDRQAAWLHNLSVKGAGLMVDQEIAPGTLLRLLVVNAPHTFALAVELRVVRCSRIINGDYFVGGQFTHDVTHADLVPFIL
jgi:PilZ domain